MSKKKSEHKRAISSFMISTYGHYLDRGMSPRSSLMRVTRETYEGLFDFTQFANIDSKDLVILEHTLAYRDFISKRGQSLIKSNKNLSDLEKKELELLYKLGTSLKEMQEFYFESNNSYEKEKRERGD